MDAVTPVPESVPAGRAVLAGTVETAVNALWDAAPMIGDRVAVVGGSSGKVYVLLATWPQDAPPAVISGVDEIVRSLHTNATGT